MNRVRNLNITLLSLILISIFAQSSQAEFDWDAKYAGDFISGQSSARLLALGGVGVAIADGPSAIVANPARIAINSLHSLSLMHADRFESAVKVDHINYVRRGENGQYIGFAVIRQGVDDIAVTGLRNPSLPLSGDNRVLQTGSTSASEYAFLLSTSKEKKIGTIGGTAKLIYKNLDGHYALGLGIDLGYSKSFGSLILAAQLRDGLIPSVIAWDTGRQETIKPTLRVGAAYVLKLERMEAVAIPIFEFEERFESFNDDDAYVIHAGFEYTIKETVSARIGMDDDRITYGAGISVSSLDLNYAFIGHEDLGATHRVSISFIWGRK
jgi:hypothetical protein